MCSKPHIPSSPTQRDLHLVDGEGAGAFQGLDEQARPTHRDRGEWAVGEVERRAEEQPRDVADFHYSLEERCRLQDVEVRIDLRVYKQARSTQAITVYTMVCTSQTLQDGLRADVFLCECFAVSGIGTS